MLNGNDFVIKGSFGISSLVIAFRGAGTYGDMGTCPNHILEQSLKNVLFLNIVPKKTGPWNGHSLVIFPSWKPEGISKYDYNTICLT